MIRIAEDGLHFRGIDEIIFKRWVRYLGCSEQDLMFALLALLVKGVKLKKK